MLIVSTAVVNMIDLVNMAAGRTMVDNNTCVCRYRGCQYINTTSVNMMIINTMVFDWLVANTAAAKFAI